MRTIRNTSGIDMFWNAASRDNLSDIRQYIAAQIDVNATDRYGQTALHKAAIASSTNTVVFLLKLPYVDIYKRDNAGNTPLDIANLFQNNKIAAAIEAEAARRETQLTKRSQIKAPPYAL